MPAENVPVRQPSGAVHGFLELRSDDGKVLASGDTTRAISGDRITARTLFHFRDGSIDDETEVYTQRRVLQLVSYHRIQKGPTFPHPYDATVDVRSGTIRLLTWDKDGKESSTTSHMQLPADLASGIVPVITENMRENTAPITVPMLVFAPKPRLVKLVITRTGEQPSSVVGVPHPANHFDIKIDLGGVAGVVAPLIGKAPPDIQIWTISGAATTFARAMEPLYAEGPIVTVQLASPTWPDEEKH